MTRSRGNRSAVASLGAGLLLVVPLGACRSGSSGGADALPTRMPTDTLTAMSVPGPVSTNPGTVRAMPRPAGSVGGVVTDAARRPVAGLEVHATSTADPSQVMSAPWVTTDARGHYTWDGLTPGPYAVTVTSGGTDAAGLVTVVTGSSTRLDLVLR